MTSFDFPDTDSNVPNREELLQMAIRAAKAGNREGSRVMLRKVLSEDRRNERAMLWMAKLATNKTERRQWLNRILVVNPNQQSAKDALRRMDYKSSARDNRVLIVFGVVALIMIVVAIVIVLGLASGR